METPLDRDIAALEGQGLALRCHPQPDGWLFLVFVAYPLGPHFDRASADLLVKVPPMYPFAGFDMFWTAPGVRLADGRMPTNTSVEMIMGAEWLRFSWHPTSWRQGVDSLVTYRVFIDRRLAAGE